MSVTHTSRSHLLRFIFILSVAFATLATESEPASAANRSVSVGQQNGGTTAAQNFNPAVRQVIAGDTVTWYHAYGTHDVQGYSGGWGSGPKGGMNPGGAIPTYARVFSTPGTYTYYCDEHSGPSDAEPDRIDERIAEGKMVGKIVVLAATPPSVTNVVTDPNPTGGALTISLSATVTDDVAVTSARYRINSGFPVAMTLSGSTASATVPMEGVPVGSNQITVEASDALGSVGSRSVVLFVEAPAGGGDPGGGGGSGGVPVSIGLYAGNFANDTTPVNLGFITLTGSDAEANGQLDGPWTAIDARGTGAGWNVTITCTDFVAAGGSIPVNKFRVFLAQADIVSVGGNFPPLTGAATAVPLSSTTPLKLLYAGLTTGMGTYRYSPQFTLTVPATTVPGTYVASVTVSITSGP